MREKASGKRMVSGSGGPNGTGWWWLATRMGFEPTISGVTGQYVSRYTTGPRKDRAMTAHRSSNNSTV